jgi:ubiquinol-cytochrome c reductase cytochrome c1 subunit
MLKHMMIKGLVLAATLFTAGSVSAEEGGGLQMAQTRVSNLASVQSGARLFFNYCSGCHSLKYMSYSQLGEDLHLGKDEVLKNFAFTGAKIGDQVLTNMPGDNAKTWFGNTPPDLSLEARAKGPDWIYTYLKSFYLDPSRPTGWNNTVFPSVSMPNVLWELQGTQRAVMAPAKAGEEGHVERLEPASPGKLSPAAFDEAASDLTAFLEYAGEPAKVKREAMGVWVVLFLAFFTFMAYLLKHEYWKDVH